MGMLRTVNKCSNVKSLMSIPMLSIKGQFVVAAGWQGLPRYLFGRGLYTRIELAHRERQILGKDGPCPTSSKGDFYLPSWSQFKLLRPTHHYKFAYIIGWRKIIQIAFFVKANTWEVFTIPPKGGRSVIMIKLPSPKFQKLPAVFV